MVHYDKTPTMVVSYLGENYTTGIVVSQDVENKNRVWLHINFESLTTWPFVMQSVSDS